MAADLSGSEFLGDYALLAGQDEEEMQAALAESENLAPTDQERKRDAEDLTYAPSPPPVLRRPRFVFTAQQATALVAECVDRADVTGPKDLQRLESRLDLTRCNTLWQRIGTRVRALLCAFLMAVSACDLLEWARLCRQVENRNVPAVEQEQSVRLSSMAFLHGCWCAC